MLDDWKKNKLHILKSFAHPDSNIFVRPKRMWLFRCVWLFGVWLFGDITVYFMQTLFIFWFWWVGSFLWSLSARGLFKWVCVGFRISIVCVNCAWVVYRLGTLVRLNFFPGGQTFLTTTATAGLLETINCTNWILIKFSRTQKSVAKTENQSTFWL